MILLQHRPLLILHREIIKEHIPTMRLIAHPHIKITISGHYNWSTSSNRIKLIGRIRRAGHGNRSTGGTHIIELVIKEDPVEVGFGIPGWRSRVLGAQEAGHG